MRETLVWTPEQQLAIDEIKTFLNHPIDVLFTLKGVGGAGKTTVIRAVLENRIGVIGAAISHSAKIVLQESLGSTVPCYTVAQLLGLKQTINEESGQIQFVVDARSQNKVLPLDHAKIVIIDECSMIDTQTFNRIMSRRESHCKVIMLGDPFQLPPVDDVKSDSITFDHTKAELITAVRYTGPLADLGGRIREEIQKVNDNGDATENVLNVWQMSELGNDSRTSHVNEDGSGYIFLNSAKDVVRIAAQAFKEAEHSEAIRILAYRNSTVSTINGVIRTELYCGGDSKKIATLPQYVKGELVICDGGYSIGNVPIIHNNQMFEVEGMIPIEGPKGIPSLSLNLYPPVAVPDGEQLQALDWENGQATYLAQLNGYKDSAKRDGSQWTHYYNFKAQWAWFDYAYSLTVHKSQGRTFNDVIVFEHDIFDIKRTGLKEKLQALYVACTRAKRRVIIYNKRFRCDQSELPEFVRKELGI